jgi:hypothetical protein
MLIEMVGLSMGLAACQGSTSAALTTSAAQVQATKAPVATQTANFL